MNDSFNNKDIEIIIEKMKKIKKKIEKLDDNIRKIEYDMMDISNKLDSMMQYEQNDISYNDFLLKNGYIDDLK